MATHAPSNEASFAHLAVSLENIANDPSARSKCTEATRVRLLEAVKAALPQLEKQDDALHRVLFGVCP